MRRDSKNAIEYTAWYTIFVCAEFLFHYILLYAQQQSQTEFFYRNIVSSNVTGCLFLIIFAIYPYAVWKIIEKLILKNKLNNREKIISWLYIIVMGILVILAEMFCGLFSAVVSDFSYKDHSFTTNTIMLFLLMGRIFVTVVLLSIQTIDVFVRERKLAKQPKKDG